MIASLRTIRLWMGLLCSGLAIMSSASLAAEQKRVIPVSYLKLSSHQSLAAAKILQSLQQRSFDEQSEFCGVLYLKGNQVLASKPVRGDQASCGVDLAQYENLKLVATYHTHGRHDEGYDNEVPSTQDLRSSENTGLNDYVSTPGGRLWLVSHAESTAFKICDLKCLVQDTRFSECAAGVPRDHYNRQTLAARGRDSGRFCD